MRILASTLISAGVLGFMTISVAQERPKEEPRQSVVERMMAFDKNKDGKITKEEVTEERAQRVFTRADANKDGVVTKEELTALAAQEAAISGESGRRPEGKGGDRGREGKGGDFDKGRFMRPTPGQILSPFMQESLHLSDDQKKQLADLQKQVDSKLQSILTNEQKHRLHDMREGGRDGRPGEGGRRPEGSRPPEGGKRPEGGRPPEGNRPRGENKDN